MTEKRDFKNLKDFYPYYLDEHSNKRTKLMHFIGTAFSILFLVAFLVTFEPGYILYALLSGYGFAWVSHLFIEKNRPATFQHPLLSLASDFKMFFEILMGKHKIF